MSAKRRYGRPDWTVLLAMMALNAVVALAVLTLVLKLFGLNQILPPLPAAAHTMGTLSGWVVALPMAPGAGIGYGCLWYWLILVGRSRGVPWGGALLYGAALALVNVPLGGLVLGALHGAPLIGLLMGLAMLLLLPSLLLAMLVAGIALGSLNGWAANRWIERQRRP